MVFLVILQQPSLWVQQRWFAAREEVWEPRGAFTEEEMGPG